MQNMVQIVAPKTLEDRQIPFSVVDLVVSGGSCDGGPLLALGGLGGAPAGRKGKLRPGVFIYPW